MNKSTHNTPDGKYRGILGYLRCTRVVLLCALLAILLNLPGQMVAEPVIHEAGKYGPHFEVCEHCEHGWPFTYMWREWVTLESPPYWRLSHWRIFEGVQRLDMFACIANVLVSTGIVLLAGRLLRNLRRRRQRLLQLHVIDWLVVTGILCACAAFYAFHASVYRREMAILQAIAKEDVGIQDDSSTIGERVDWCRGGPTWLRPYLGDRAFRVFDRVVGISICRGGELKHVVKLSHLRVVRITTAVSNRELRLLQELPQLEALDMSYANIVRDNGSGSASDLRFRLPQLHNLRGLNLYGTSFDGAGLENIPLVESLDLTRTDVGDECVGRLLALDRLKQLSLTMTRITESGIATLRREKPNCTIFP